MEQKTTIKSESTTANKAAKTKKPMPPSRKKEHTRKNITVRFSDFEREKLEKAAEKSGLLLTQLIRARALKEDQTAAKKLETLSDLRRSLSLIKAVYKALANSNLAEYEKRIALDDLNNVRCEIAYLASLFGKK